MDSAMKRVLIVTKTFYLGLAWLLLINTGAPSHAQGGAVINIDETVTGNQEQPKVLYIVPWKTAADSEDFQQSLQQKTSGRVFRHLEKEELQRQVEFLAKSADTQE